MTVVAFTVVLLGGVLAGCASTPRAVLNVPGTYTADLWTPTLQYPQGGPVASVLMCLDEPSAVELFTAPGSMGSLWAISLDWGGTLYDDRDLNDPYSSAYLLTPVLQPGCGLLTFTDGCCHVDHYVTIAARKA